MEYKGRVFYSITGWPSEDRATGETVAECLRNLAREFSDTNDATLEAVTVEGLDGFIDVYNYEFMVMVNEYREMRWNVINVEDH